MPSKVMTIVLVAILAVSGSLAQGRYSSDLLAEPAAMDRAEWVVDLTRFNNWLNEHYDKIPQERISGPREHIYLLIDSILRDQYSEGRSEFSEVELFGLKTLFNWGTRLGLYGSGLVARHLAGKEVEGIQTPLVPPHPFVLRLNYPRYTLSSTSGKWNVEFPFYFMIGDVKRFESSVGMDTELAIISTLFAKHRRAEGQSQATIMLVFSPTRKGDEFRDYWLDLYKLSKETKAKQPALPDSDTYYTFVESEDMHKELTFMRGKRGHYLVSYLGRDGTYQVNRTHYIAFLRYLERG